MNIYAKAARIKLRFATIVGSLSVEDLWDLPLQSDKGKANLDDIAKALRQTVKASAEESFVTPTNKVDERAQLAFDIVLDMINTKIAERDAATQLKAKAETRQKILAIIAKKQDEAIEGKSVEELTKMLESL